LEIIDRIRSAAATDFSAKVRAHAKMLGLTVSD
jgi:hypothetical protein